MFLPPPPPPPPPPPIPPPRLPENRVPPFRPRGPRLPPPGGLRSRGLFSLLFSAGALVVSDFTFGVSVPAMVARAPCSAFGCAARREKNLDFFAAKIVTLHRFTSIRRNVHYGVRQRKRPTRRSTMVISHSPPRFQSRCIMGTGFAIGRLSSRRLVTAGVIQLGQGLPILQQRMLLIEIVCLYCRLQPTGVATYSKSPLVRKSYLATDTVHLTLQMLQNVFLLLFF